MKGRQLLVLLCVVVLIKCVLVSSSFQYDFSVIECLTWTWNLSIICIYICVLYFAHTADTGVDNFAGNKNGLHVIDEYNFNQVARECDTDNTYTRNLIRTLTMKKFCAEFGYSYANNTTEMRAHVAPNNTVLYCRVNKCASTMTLELLKQLFDCDTDCLIQNAKFIKQDTLNAYDIMRKAFSFIVVREPYARLLSTYSNIFYFPKEDWLYRSTKIIKQVRNNPSLDSLKYGHDLRFAELIKYIVESYEKGLRIDEHVRPMSHKSCNPCLFSFDFVVKLETIKSDLEYLLCEWQRRKFIKNYDVDILSKLKERTKYGPIKHLFRVIPLIKDSNISLYSIFLRAWSYYQITGHVSKHYDFPFDEQEIDSITVTHFRSSLEKAMEMSANASHDLKLQRIEAMKEAYSTVPMEYIDRLQNVVRSDCLMFGYNQKSTLLTNLATYNSDDRFYFKGLDS